MQALFVYELCCAGGREVKGDPGPPGPPGDDTVCMLDDVSDTVVGRSLTNYYSIKFNSDHMVWPLLPL